MNIVFLLLKLHSLAYTYLDVMEYTINLSEFLFVIAYQVKFYRWQQLTSNIQEDLIYLDTSLESLGAKVPYARNKLEAILFAAVGCTLCTVYVYGYSNSFDYFTSKTNDFIIHLFIVSRTVLTTATTTFFEVYFYFTLYLMQQRVRLIRNVVERFLEFSGRNFAWSSDVATASVEAAENVLMEVQAKYKAIRSICSCFFDTFQTVKRLYTLYFCCYLWSTAAWYSTEDVYKRQGES